MKDQLNQWLADKGEIPGVLTAGFVHPDKSIFCQSFSDHFAENWFYKILFALIEILQKSQQQKLPDARMRWSFEHFLLHCTFRKDGSCFAVLTERNLAPHGARNVENLLKEVRGL